MKPQTTQNRYEVDKKLVMDYHSLYEEYKAEPQEKYDDLIDSHFDSDNKQKLEEGFTAISKPLCLGSQRGWGTIEVTMRVDINTDASTSTHFLSPLFIDKETGLNLRRNTHFRDFTKLSIYIEEHYKGRADKRLLSDSCVVSGTLHNS